MPKTPHYSPKRPLIDDAGEVRELTAEDFAAMRPARDVVPDIVEASRRDMPGRPAAD